MTTFSLLSYVLLVALIPLTGALLAITPWLMRRNECFAVTIPADKQRDPRLVALKRRYTKQVALITVALTVVAAIVFALFGKDANISEGALVATMVAGTLAPIVISFALMLKSRREVQAIKAAEGWFAPRQQAAAIVAEEDAPSAISLAWNLLYIPICVGTVALGAALYPTMPEVIPMKINFAGEVVSSMPKGPGVIGFPVLLTAFMAAVMTFSHWSIMRSKRPTDPSAPATSSLAYGMFARAQSILIVVTGLLLTAVIDISFILSAANVVSLETMAALIMAPAIIVVIAAMGLSVAYGQAGSKLHARMQGSEAATPLAFDDDEHWILGVIYFNRDDASLFLPERFGIGWTINMARPAAWGILIGFVVLTAAFIAATFVLMQ